MQKFSEKSKLLFTRIPGILFILLCIVWTTSLGAVSEPIIAYVLSPGLGEIAVRIEMPDVSRYSEGAPVVVEVSTWFVSFAGFHRVNDTRRIGAVTISYLWPSRADPETGARSEGVYDYGGPTSLAALRDVIRFAGGMTPDVQGRYIEEIVSMPILTENLGLFASSHAGVVATNVLAHHGSEIPKVKYLIGRENPTRDEMYPLELGYFDDARRPIHNTFYNKDDYSTTELTVDYSTVGWYEPGGGEQSRPYFAATADNPEHVLHETIGPKMWGKRYYSRAITQALLDNGALTLENWPDDLATPAETHSAWPFRITVNNYPAIAAEIPDLKVMLVFSKDDHVQAARTKPHIHQAYDGFQKGADCWVRMNPDRSYVQSIDSGYGVSFPDNDANSEPNEWMNVREWGFPADAHTREHVWLASAAEMADRVQNNDWSPNLSDVYFPVLVETDVTYVAEVSQSIPKEPLIVYVYPNPFNSRVQIFIQTDNKHSARIRIYNNMGQLIDEITPQKYSNGQHRFVWDAHTCRSGVYFCRVQTGNEVISKRIVLQR